MKLFSKRQYPDWWSEYERSFKEAAPKDISDATFVVFDTETTGLQVGKDRILSIGAVKLRNGQMALKEVFECYLKQEHFNPEVVSVHGIREEGSFQKKDELEAVQEFISYLGNAVIVAHHTSFDVAIINDVLQRHKLPKLKNRTVDTADIFRRFINKPSDSLSLDTLAAHFQIPLHDRHTATGDAYITAQLFLKILQRIPSEKRIRLTDLYHERNLNNGLL